jgi:hypothetical protein
MGVAVAVVVAKVVAVGVVAGGAARGGVERADEVEDALELVAKVAPPEQGLEYRGVSRM